ncbi:phosphonatase-like hydrolase [Mucilaginibacter gracilis]|uniref:Phosphonatase-like hydrolase n=2 Tax=Mucilaginibacter gracilis TaxID=423350 RepID=A0A495J7K6_9SPHI|nr:phosphonatase-like hydrolase [Mucilaginibacter gracilis]
MVVFDMAGTTVNENNVVYKTLRKAINEAGFNFTLDEVLAQGAGKEKLQAIKSVLNVYANNTDDALANSIYQNFIVQLADAYAKIEIFEQANASQLFAALKKRGILVVLNTGYNRQTALSLISKLGWQTGVDFDGLVTATDVSKNRPNPDMIWHAMQQFNITDAKTVAKVGDSIIDIEEGKNAGCGLNIGITSGAHTSQQLQTANPYKVIDNLIELLAVLDNQ